MAGISIPHVETVLLENSDDRLAKVEEAKRTGMALESVGANPSVVVPVPVAQKILDEASNLDTYVGLAGITSAAHLKDYHEKVRNDPDFIPTTNEEKAKAHEEYSAELVRKQQEENKRIEELKAQGYEPWKAVQQANLERALEHEQKSAEFVKVRDERNANAKDVWTVVDESVEALQAKDLFRNPKPDQIEKALAKVIDVPDVSESQAREALITKDAIIETAEDFKDHAKDFESLQAQDRPGVAILEAASSPEDLDEETEEGQEAAKEGIDLKQAESEPADATGENPSE